MSLVLLQERSQQSVEIGLIYALTLRNCTISIVIFVIIWFAGVKTPIVCFWNYGIHSFCVLFNENNHILAESYTRNK